VGAVAAQALANARYGHEGLSLMKGGLSANQALDRLLAGDAGSERRQVGIVGVDGSAAAHTGLGCSPWAGHSVGTNFTCQGNLLAGPHVIEAMAATFRTATGSFTQRLYAALAAGDHAGGDRRGRQSAALHVQRTGGGYQKLSDVVADLRVDDSPDPLQELARLLALHELYFGSTPEADRLSLSEPAVLGAILSAMAAAGVPVRADNIDDAVLLREVERFLGSENLEERIDMARLTIDPPALAYLEARYSDGKEA